MPERKRHRGGEGQAGHPALCILPEVEKEDEVLEAIWTLREEGKHTWSEIVEACEIDGCEDTLKDLARTGWIEVKDQDVELLTKGDKRARELVRRHRLSLRLFHDLFSLMMQKPRHASSSTFCLLR